MKNSIRLAMLSFGVLCGASIMNPASATTTVVMEDHTMNFVPGGYTVDIYVDVNCTVTNSGTTDDDLHMSDDIYVGNYKYFTGNPINYTCPANHTQALNFPFIAYSAPRGTTYTSKAQIYGVTQFFNTTSEDTETSPQ